MNRRIKKRNRRKEAMFERMIVAIIAVIIICIGVVTVKALTKEPDTQQVQAEETTTPTPTVTETPTVTPTPTESETEVDRYAIFDTMSQDWGDEIEGFVFYEIPEEYAENGGYFPEVMQVYTWCICKEYGVRYELVVAMIERETGYVFDAVGDDGESVGYMQIQEKWHKDRMERLNCNDLMNPYQNVRVGIDFLAYLLEKYGTIQDALAAYNYGETGARKHLWSKGVYVYSYNREIMSRMKEIEEELQQ